MADRGGARLLLEAAFLAALAAALAFADLRRYEIAAGMLLGWLCVALFEWGALRGRPHYGSGRPPRWYVPQLSLPPPRPLEQLAAGYPAAESSGDAPTWIASPALLAEWPVADVEPPPPEEQTSVQPRLEDTGIEEPPEEPPPPAPPPAEPEPEPEPEPVAAAPEPVVRTERHRIDPLAAPAPRQRRRGRRPGEPSGEVEVSARPPEPRPLPIRMRGER